MEQQYVVVAAWEFGGVNQTELLGITKDWTNAFRLLSGCDYKGIILGEVKKADWEEKAVIKSFDRREIPEHRHVYSEIHRFEYVGQEIDAYPVGVTFYIFEA